MILIDHNGESLTKTTDTSDWGHVIGSNGSLTMLYRHVADIPENERHGSPWLCRCLLGIIPGIAAPIDSSGAKAVDMDSLAAYHKASRMVLEGNRIGVVSQVGKVIRELV